MPALTDSAARHLLKAAPTRTLINAGQDKYQYREIDGFLRLPSSRVTNPEDSYRKITSKDDDHSDDSMSISEEEDASSSDGDDLDTTAMSALQTTLKSLEEQLATDPSSISNWLSLLFHTLSTIPSDAKNSSLMKSEITLSILSRALEAHPDNKTSKALLLRYLLSGEEVWADAKLADEWEHALDRDSVDIWVEWLDWKVRRAHSMDDVAEAADRVLSTLRRTDNTVGCLRAFWRVAVAFRDAGQRLV